MRNGQAVPLGIRIVQIVTRLATTGLRLYYFHSRRFEGHLIDFLLLQYAPKADLYPAANV